MRKNVILIFTLVFLLTAAAVSAAENTVVCGEPEILEDGRLAVDCRPSDEAAGYAVRRDVFERLMDVEGRYELVSETFLDADGNPVSGPGGFARMTAEYVMSRGGRVCRYYFTEGDPDNNICGYTYRYYDAEGQPVLITDGYEGHRYRTAGGEGFGWLILRGYPFEPGGYAAYTVSMTRTDEGFEHRQTYLGTDGLPVLRQGIYASFERITSARGMEDRYYGTDGGLIDTPLGYARSAEVYTEDLTESVVRYYAADGSLAVDAGLGVHAIRYVHAGHRKITRTDYLDVNDEPVNCAKGYAAIINEYPVQTGDVPSLRSYTPVRTVYLDRDGNEVEITE